MGFDEWLRDAIEAHFRMRYYRHDDVVYVHELLRPARLLPELRREQRVADSMGYLLVGEAVELGLREIIGAQEPERVTTIVRAEEINRSVLEALREAGVNVMRLRRGYGVMVAGKTDLLVEDDPDGARLWELKTTRRRGADAAYMDKWRLQARIYAAMYGEPVRLVILHIASGELRTTTEVYAPDRAWLECYVRRWLLGELYPWLGCRER